MAVALNERQLTVCRYVVKGLTNKQIAALLDTTEGQIKNELRRIFDKTGMSTRLELAMWCLEKLPQGER